jgi:hypothetical protein
MKPSSTLLRACGRGNQSACTIARKIRAIFSASALSFSDVKINDGHENKLPFQGVLLLVDVASDKPPHGSEGHRIYVPRKAAMDALPGLIGQAVNYQPEGLNAHASRHKVGVITKAWMEGNEVKVAGFIWIHDFPEAHVLKGRKDLGMSMELSSVYVKDEDADVWNLEKFSFTGGTILKKSAAAYTKTDLAAVAAAAEGKRGKQMAKHKEKERKVAAAHHRDRGGSLSLMTQAITASLGSAVTNAMTPILQEIKASNERAAEQFEELKGLHLINAAAQGEDEDDDEVVVHAAQEDDDDDEIQAAKDASSSASASEEADAEEMAAARKKGGGADNFDDDADDSSSSASASYDASSDMEAMEDLELEDASQEPGEVNKDASSRGSKTSVTKPPTQGEHFKGNVAKGRLKARGGKVKKTNPFPNLKGSATTIQAAAMIGDLQASVRQLRREMRAQATEHSTTVNKLRKKLQRVTAQAAHFAELEGRHSRMSNELVSLGEKVGVDFNEVRQTGQKFSVRAFDSILAAAEETGILLNPQQRIAMKMLAEEQGLLDEGVVNRIGRA